MTTERISVIMPAYNTGRYIAESIESVLRQTFPCHELIVVDDGSTDDTRERAAAYQDRLHYVRQSNQGVAAARNLGLSMATGDLVAFLDSDDIWHAEKLARQVDCFRRRPELGFLATALFAWPASKMPVVEDRDAGLVPIDWSSLAIRNFLATSSIVVRREVLQRAGPFDTELHGPEDYDLWLRATATTPAARLYMPLTGYRDTPGSLSKQPLAMYAGLRRILEKLDQSGSWRGNHLLRRKAYSYCEFTSAHNFRLQDRHREVLWMLLRSLWYYPLPFSSSEISSRFARPRLLARTCLRLMDTASRAATEYVLRDAVKTR